MARLSDIIECFIKEMIEEQGREIQIQRNELASQFSCAPSQINYVLTTRFTNDKGYVIESRRGGGGYIVIKRIEYENEGTLKKIIIDKIGESITYDSALALINGLYESKIISMREEELMKAAINERSLAFSNDKNKLRADILKSMINIL